MCNWCFSHFQLCFHSELILKDLCMEAKTAMITTAVDEGGFGQEGKSSPPLINVSLPPSLRSLHQSTEPSTASLGHYTGPTAHERAYRPPPPVRDGVQSALGHRGPSEEATEEAQAGGRRPSRPRSSSSSDGDSDARGSFARWAALWSGDTARAATALSFSSAAGGSSRASSPTAGRQLTPSTSSAEWPAGEGETVPTTTPAPPAPTTPHRRSRIPVAVRKPTTPSYAAVVAGQSTPSSRSPSATTTTSTTTVGRAPALLSEQRSQARAARREEERRRAAHEEEERGRAEDAARRRRRVVRAARPCQTVRVVAAVEWVGRCCPGCDP
ncbi:MAG: hypothetical protein M1833_002174 [Piccolia ochrophora]|nr:MAG: hypothetical protein M1833_002174 [Piccolia ochrophora]